MEDLVPAAADLVFSCPMLSEIQPKNGRVSPLSTRSKVAANVNAGSVIPNSDTETASTLRSFAIGERFAVTI